RVAVADTTEAMVLMAIGRYVDALPVHLRIATDVTLDEESQACGSSNAGLCYLELSQFAEAKRAFARAITSFENLGLVSRRAMARWGLARCLSEEGRFEQALPLLFGVREEFEELGMSEDVAVVSLHAAHALLVLQRPGD